jgi:hypothetical protein
MTRYRLPTVVVTGAGTLAAGVHVVVRFADDARPAEIYAAVEGDVLLAAPLATDDRGAAPGWVPAGEYIAELEAGDGAIVSGQRFRVGPPAPPALLELIGGWTAYPRYATPEFAVRPDGAVEVTGVINAPDDQGGAAATCFAQLPAGARPSRALDVPAMIGCVTPEGVDVRLDSVVALPDGRLRAPNEPCRWVSLIAPIKG